MTSPVVTRAACFRRAAPLLAQVLVQALLVLLLVALQAPLPPQLVATAPELVL
jgi:hypothetical protein